LRQEWVIKKKDIGDGVVGLLKAEGADFRTGEIVYRT
jgi:hypothetical protein